MTFDPGSLCLSSALRKQLHYRTEPLLLHRMFNFFPPNFPGCVILFNEYSRHWRRKWNFTVQINHIAIQSPLYHKRCNLILLKILTFLKLFVLILDNYFIHNQHIEKSFERCLWINQSTNQPKRTVSNKYKCHTHLYDTKLVRKREALSWGLSSVSLWGEDFDTYWCLLYDEHWHHPKKSWD